MSEPLTQEQVKLVADREEVIRRITADVNSDLAKFIALYESVGVSMEPIPAIEKWEGHFDIPHVILTVSISTKDSPIENYSGFFTEIHFDFEKGKFLRQVIAE